MEMLRMVLLAFMIMLMAAGTTLAAEEVREIQDNSFLIEEAFPRLSTT